MLDFIFSYVSGPVLAFIGGLIGYPLTTRTFRYLGRKVSEFWQAVLVKLAEKVEVVKDKAKDAID